MCVIRQDEADRTRVGKWILAEGAMTALGGKRTFPSGDHASVLNDIGLADRDADKLVSTAAPFQDAAHSNWPAVIDR